MDISDLDFDLDISQEDLQHIEALESSIFSEIRNLAEEEISNDAILPTKKRYRRVIASSSESETESVENYVSNQIARIEETSNSVQKWTRPRGHQPSVIAFTEPTGMKQPYARELKNSAAGEYFSVLVPDSLFETIANETNLFAQQSLSKTLKPKSRANEWKPTSKDEIKQLFGLILYMGLVKLPQINLYWSKDRVFGQHFPATVMSRNRCELLLRMIHFTDNETADKSDRIFKIRPLINALNENFKKLYAPNETVCVDESQVAFRGRIIFRQYNKSKRHKYGMKMFKLCTLPGYTCKLQLYAGKNDEMVNTTPTNVVMSLCDDILNLGHTIATDNWYTNLDLANQLLNHDTHLIGTIRKNRRGLPMAVVDAKLEKGESIAMENQRGITVLKWKDKRDVLVLSTKHSNGKRTVLKKGRAIKKPKIILAYNEAKSSVDMSDQMTSYSSPLRKTMKWYKKLAIELILNTALVNAWIMYKENKNTNQGIVQFRRQLVEYLVDSGVDKENCEQQQERPKRMKHELLKREGPVAKLRRFCVGCYKENVKTHGSKVARNKTKKVVTYCKNCPGTIYYCLQCFNKSHRYL